MLQIRREHELDGKLPREIMAKWRALLPSKAYLRALLTYQTRSLIFPEDGPDVVRK